MCQNYFTRAIRGSFTNESAQHRENHKALRPSSPSSLRRASIHPIPSIQSDGDESVGDPLSWSVLPFDSASDTTTVTSCWVSYQDASFTSDGWLACDDSAVLRTIQECFPEGERGDPTSYHGSFQSMQRPVHVCLMLLVLLSSLFQIPVSDVVYSAQLRK